MSALGLFISDLVNSSTFKPLRPGSYEFIKPVGKSPARERRATPETEARRKAPPQRKLPKSGGLGAKNDPMRQLLKNASADVQSVVTQVKNKGAKVEQAGSAHLKISGGGTFVIIGTKQHRRGMLKQIGELRRAGLLTA